jgi:hypothetical protein
VKLVEVQALVPIESPRISDLDWLLYNLGEWIEPNLLGTHASSVVLPLYVVLCNRLNLRQLTDENLIALSSHGLGCGEVVLLWNEWLTIKVNALLAWVFLRVICLLLNATKLLVWLSLKVLVPSTLRESHGMDKISTHGVIEIAKVIVDQSALHL